MTTAGLDNVGEPADGLPLHGTYNYLPAESVEIDGNRISATIADARGIVVQRQIVNDPDRGHLRLDDTTSNTSAEPQPAPLLYHCNFLLGDVDIDSESVEPRDAASAAGDWWTVGTGGGTGLRAHRRAALARPDRRAGRRDPVEPAPALAVGRPRARRHRHRAGELLRPGACVRRLRRETADPAARRGARDVARHHRQRMIPAGYLAISQMCPPGSTKLAVRIPHGRSIGPFSSSTPRDASSAHIASTSSTAMVN